MAYGELLAALPPISQTCFSTPRFPDSGCPVRRAVRQAALHTFPRSSPATTAGPSFPLTSRSLSLDNPRCGRLTRAAVSSHSLVILRGVEMKKLSGVRGKFHFNACKETFTRRPPPFLCCEGPPNAVVSTFQIL
ncbi:Hypothetical protein SMAX5B_011839 [Scophthalmus maximus]|uniref:Uncharacterized protein n=1 Tax=Scophthalmus maximus TaxID=52904 RepID=A0A2U9AXD4_SCOMX|nr:Hypothetical protein SMAX5B_011839 [Scophthalmus maximus]